MGVTLMPTTATTQVERMRARDTADACVPCAAVLDRWSDHAWRDGIQIQDLGELEMVRVVTENSVYEIVHLPGNGGEILVRGGRYLPQFRRGYLQGSSLGGAFLKQHGIYRHFRMELLVDGQRLITSRVCALYAPKSADRPVS